MVRKERSNACELMPAGESGPTAAWRAAERTWVTRRMKVDLPQPESACHTARRRFLRRISPASFHRYPPSCGHAECAEGRESTQRIQSRYHGVCGRSSRPQRVACASATAACGRGDRAPTARPIMTGFTSSARTTRAARDAWGRTAARVASMGAAAVVANMVEEWRIHVGSNPEHTKRQRLSPDTLAVPLQPPDPAEEAATSAGRGERSRAGSGEAG
jgi:hypothetical protein